MGAGSSASASEIATSGHDPAWGALDAAGAGIAVSALRRTGLEPVSFAVAAGECVALRGPSGAGKTLLLRAIADLDPNDGRAWAAGVARDSMTAPQWRRRVCYVPAEPGWWSERVGTHFANESRARSLLAALELDAAALGWPVARLSSGERQRLALARALEGAPHALLLDEPTSALDAASERAVEQLLRERLAAGAAIVLVTHDDRQAERLARRTLWLRAGRLEDAAH